MGAYRTIKRAGVGELVIRRSRFVCGLARAGSEEEARAFVAERRRVHGGASHHCSAYVLDGGVTRSSDDGEPAGTAGVPMLEVLTRRDLVNVVAVVSRYFGGIKLGAGGLARAYGQAVGEAIDLVGVVERRPVVSVTVSVEHGRAGRLLRDLHASAYRPAATRYGSRAEIDVPVPETELAAFDGWIAEATGGHADVRRGARDGYLDVDV